MRSPAWSLSILLLIALSCKKDGTSSPFSLDAPATYSEKIKTEVSSIRLFAQSGEIKNAPIINRFKNVDADYLESMGNGIFPLKGRADSIKVHDAQNVEVFDVFQYVPYKMDGKGNTVTLTAKDTTTGQSYQEVFTRTIYYNLPSNKPIIYDEYLVSSTRGYYIFEYTTQKQYHLQKEENGFQLPWIVGVIHYADGSTNYIVTQDKLNLNFYKSLASGDTVVIREYAVSYKK